MRKANSRRREAPTLWTPPSSVGCHNSSTRSKFAFSNDRKRIAAHRARCFDKCNLVRRTSFPKQCFFLGFHVPQLGIIITGRLGPKWRVSPSATNIPRSSWRIALAYCWMQRCPKHEPSALLGPTKIQLWTTTTKFDHRQWPQSLGLATRPAPRSLLVDQPSFVLGPSVTGRSRRFPPASPSDLGATKRDAHRY
ncbi:uncharacterized protein CIMG_05545 [Coccidioides immitis RS]|uniref:Uncharacterized protein n=2 Tax=Coccidioides immitis TaxID=5501 RepID=J3KFT9_COCIM|nr:uncharacterized protein CIMG_05545 [Coccidioides immitis RS]EAS34521.3 hypothetical protein CIMG_05545 [Coccidioides immitis RS]KMU86913.1 hypothetical protein CIHG_04852 [Coccidioides immitis H538.4]